MLFNQELSRVIGAGTVMLRPVEFNPSGNPGSCKPHQSRLDHLVVINKMGMVHFIKGYLNAPSQFREYHQLDVPVFDKNSFVYLLLFLIRDFFNHRVWVDNTRTALVDSFFQKYRILLLLTRLIGGQCDLFHPCFDNRGADG